MHVDQDKVYNEVKRCWTKAKDDYFRIVGQNNEVETPITNDDVVVTGCDRSVVVTSPIS